VVREADLGVDREGRKASWKHEMRERLMELRWAEQLLLATSFVWSPLLKASAPR
jgi:hypothetical protein